MRVLRDALAERPFELLVLPQPERVGLASPLVEFALCLLALRAAYEPPSEEKQNENRRAAEACTSSRQEKFQLAIRCA